MSDEYVEFQAATRANGPNITVIIDEKNAKIWGTEGWFPVSGGAAGVGKKIDGVVHLLHRLIMNAGEDDEVRFRNKNKFDVREENLYMVPKRKKLVNNKNRSGGGDATNDTESDDEGDMDSNTLGMSESRATVAQVKARKNARVAKAPKPGRKPRAVSAEPMVIERVETPLQIAPVMSGVQMVEFIPVGNQNMPAMNLITTIDHLPENGRNEIDVVTSAQYFNQQEMRTEWYTIMVDGEDADRLRTYLKLRVHGQALETSNTLAEMKRENEALKRELAVAIKRNEKLDSEIVTLQANLKTIKKQSTRLRNVAADILADQAA